LPEKELNQLETSLNFFHVEELRDIALKLSLPTKSKKDLKTAHAILERFF
jgi:hypothetical protein